MYIEKNINRVNRRKAFTLAEVLITLGIIGVVASMTIPTLIQKKAEMETAAKIKKAYSTLSNAYTLAVQENGTPDTWNLVGNADPGGAENMMNILAKYIKFTKNCGRAAGCWPENVEYKLLSGSSISPTTDSDQTIAKAQLADGSLFYIIIRNPTCNGIRGNTLPLSNICAVLSIDTNGFNSPNQYGSDLFQFYITKYGIIPEGTQQEYDANNSFASTCKDKSTNAGYGCASWVLYNENLDYLHCNNLSWGGPTKCQ